MRESTVFHLCRDTYIDEIGTESKSLSDRSAISHSITLKKEITNFGVGISIATSFVPSFWEEMATRKVLLHTILSEKQTTRMVLPGTSEINEFAEKRKNEPINWKSEVGLTGLTEPVLINAYIIAAISAGSVILMFLVTCIVYTCCRRNSSDRGTYQIATSVVSNDGGSNLLANTQNKTKNNSERSKSNQNTSTYCACDPDLDMNFDTNTSFLMPQTNGILKHPTNNHNKKTKRKNKPSSQNRNKNPLNRDVQEWYV